LKLSVKQEQKPDPDSQYPQVAFFETPVDIEIGTASGARVERVRIEPQEEQSFSFPVESQPLLVNFDYGDTLIKELHFEKTIEQLAYQLSRDTDVLGRVWALEQLTAKLKDKTSSDAGKQQMVNQLASALTSDKFWGVRLEAATALNNTPGDAVRTALLAATKDPKPRVRARALKSLASSQDASLASVYLPLLNDQSYAVIAEAARALGQTKSPAAYDALVKLVDTPSWRDNIRAAALTGLAATGDKRALELGFRYVAVGNSQAVRAGALGILGATGKDDPRTFPLVSDMFKQAFAKGQVGLIFAAAEALVALGDQRGQAVFEEVGKQAGNPQIQGFLMQFAGRLRQAAAPTPSPTPRP
jgi:aminopeptidase N